MNDAWSFGPQRRTLATLSVFSEELASVRNSDLSSLRQLDSRRDAVLRNNSFARYRVSSGFVKGKETLSRRNPDRFRNSSADYVSFTPDRWAHSAPEQSTASSSAPDGHKQILLASKSLDRVDPESLPC
jgi:hypothetical protein